MSTPLNEALLEFRRQRSDLSAIADALNVRGFRNANGRPFTADAVQKRLERLGAAKKAPPRPNPSDSQLAWAEGVISDGLPISWAAETIGLTPKPLAAWWRKRHGPSDRSFTREAWPHIRSKPHLRELHEEFAPKKGNT